MSSQGIPTASQLARAQRASNRELARQLRENEPHGAHGETQEPQTEAPDTNLITNDVIRNVYHTDPLTEYFFQNPGEEWNGLPILWHVSPKGKPLIFCNGDHFSLDKANNCIPGATGLERLDPALKILL